MNISMNDKIHEYIKYILIINLERFFVSKAIESFKQRSMWDETRHGRAEQVGQGTGNMASYFRSCPTKQRNILMRL